MLPSARQKRAKSSSTKTSCENKLKRRSGKRTRRTGSKKPSSRRSWRNITKYTTKEKYHHSSCKRYGQTKMWQEAEWAVVLEEEEIITTSKEEEDVVVATMEVAEAEEGEAEEVVAATMMTKKTQDTETGMALLAVDESTLTTLMTTKTWGGVVLECEAAA